MSTARNALAAARDLVFEVDVDACFGGCANRAQWAVALDFYDRYLRGVPLSTLLAQNKYYAKELTDLAIQIEQRRIRLDGTVVNESPEGGTA